MAANVDARGQALRPLVGLLLVATPVFAPYCPNAANAPADAAERLRAHHTELRSRCGFRPLNGAPATSGGMPPRDLRLASAWTTPVLPHYENDDWPKPAHCKTVDRHLPASTCDVPTRFLTTPPRGQGEPPGQPLVVQLVWKTGITTLKHFWRCAFDQKRHTSSADFVPESQLGEATVRVGMTRDPIERLLSSYGEILKRTTEVVRGEREGQTFRLPDLKQIERVVASTDRELMQAHHDRGVALRQSTPKQERWRAKITESEHAAAAAGAAVETPQSAAADPTAGARNAILRDPIGALQRAGVGWLVAGWTGGLPQYEPGARGTPALVARGELNESERFSHFVRSLECVERYVSWQHAATAAAFMSADHVVSSMREADRRAAVRWVRGEGQCAQHQMPAPHVTELIRQESFESDLLRVVRRTNATIPSDCTVEARNPSKLHELPGFPSKSTLREVLERDPALMRIVCRVYFQDFTCFGYPLPPACRAPNALC